MGGSLILVFRMHILCVSCFSFCLRKSFQQLFENNQVDKIHGFLKRWLLVSFFIFAINYIVVYRSAFIGVPLSDREETSCAFLLLAFGILSWILCAAVSIYKEVRSVC